MFPEEYKEIRVGCFDLFASWRGVHLYKDKKGGKQFYKGAYSFGGDRVYDGGYDPGRKYNTFPT